MTFGPFDCPVITPLGPVPDTVPAVPSVAIELAGDQINDGVEITVRRDPTRPPGGLPSVNGFTITRNPDPDMDVLNIDLNTVGASGFFILVIRNPSGCAASCNMAMS